jgi:cytidylate kinase
MKRAYSVDNVLRAKFATFAFEGEWQAAIGHPERAGTWMIYGPPKQGKTTFAMKLAKYLTRFERVAYNSVEEGLSLSVQHVFDRVGMREAGSRLVLLDRDSVDDLIGRLQVHRSPGVAVIDSMQFWEMDFKVYRRLKELFPHKVFIYVSHVEGGIPQGATARRVWRDASVAFRVDRFRAFPSGRFGGGEPVTVSEERAEELWKMK